MKVCKKCDLEKEETLFNKEENVKNVCLSTKKIFTSIC